MKKGILAVHIIVVVILSTFILGFVFKGEIIYQASPKLYLSTAVLNTTKKINNTPGLKEHILTVNAENKTFTDMIKTNTKTNISLSDDSIANLYLGNLKPSLEIIDDVNNKVLNIDFSNKNSKLLGFYLGEDNSIIDLNNNQYSIENKTFVTDYNTWYDNNEKALNTWQSILGTTNAFSKIPTTYDKQVNYTFFKNMIESLASYDKKYNPEILKQAKDLLSNATYTKEKSAEPNTKQISLIIKEQDAKNFIESLSLTSSLNNFYTNGDLSITFVIEKNFIKNLTVCNLNNKDYKIKIGVDNVDDYLKDFYLTLIENQSEDQAETKIFSGSINNMDVSFIDVTMKFDVEEISINFTLDRARTSDNFKIVVGNAAGTLLGSNIELLGSYEVALDKFLFSLNTIKMPNQTDANIGFVSQIVKHDETLELPKSNIKFFETKFETILMDLFIVSKSLGL